MGALPMHKVWAATEVKSARPSGMQRLNTRPLEKTQVVMRIGASPPHQKKLPWNSPRASSRIFATGKGECPQRVGCHVKRPQVPLTAIGDASGVFTPAPPMREPRLGMAEPRNAARKCDPGRRRQSVETIAGHDPERAKGRFGINEAKGSGAPSLSARVAPRRGTGYAG